MKQNARKYLSAFALLEWGAIMLYFFISGRLAAFLHPNFHGMVLTSGIVLVFSAVCCLIAGGNGPEHDCGNEQDKDLSIKTAFSFCMLLVPIALATFISPDGFSAAKIRNTGFVENARALPGAADHAKRITESVSSADEPRSHSAPVYAGVEQPKDADNQLQAFTPDIQDKNGKVYSLPLHAKTDAPVANNVIPTDLPLDSSPKEKGQFKPDKDGFYGVTVIDLFWGTEDLKIRERLVGRPLKILGQYMSAAATDAKLPHFQLMRLFMVCCAADARPVKLLVEIQSLSKPFHAPAEMKWLNVMGSVKYQKTGDKLTPVFIARNIASAPVPKDPFAY